MTTAMDKACESLHSVLFHTDPHRERISVIKSLPGVEECTQAALVAAAAAEDWLVFNEYLIAAYARPHRGLTKILCEVLSRQIPEVNNEDIASVLEEVRDPQSLDCLTDALRWLPEWDEFHALAVKCVWAIGAIGNPRAKEILEEVVSYAPQRVREAAASALRKL
jgi:hypothetical protein